MEPVEVTAQFDTQGKFTPLRFTWQGRSYPVESTGRSWEDSDGQHILVMVASGKIFELLFAPAEGRWYLGRLESGRMMA